MADISILSRMIGGVVRNIDMSANTLIVSSVKVGGSVSNTELTKTILDSLILHDHAPMSDNQTITAGSGLTGGGAGASVTLDVGQGNGITVSADAIAVNYDDSSIGLDGSNKLAVKASGVTNDMLAGSIADSKLSTITTTNKVSGSAVQLQSSKGLEDATGLGVKVNTATMKVDVDGVSVKDGGISDSQVAAAANIAVSKLASVTASKVLVSDSSGKVSASAVSDTTLAFLDATSSIQTQLNDKLSKTGGTMTGDITLGANKITTSATSWSDNELVPKSYVDSVAQGLDVHAAVHVATTEALDVTASGSGVGKTLTFVATGLSSVDGIALDTIGMRVLVKNQGSEVHNGIYTVTTVGASGVACVLTRSTDFDGSPAAEVNAGDFMFVETGSIFAKSGWVVQAYLDTHPVVDTDPIVFSQFSGAGTYSAGDALSLTGTEFDVKFDNSTVGLNGSNQLQVKDNSISEAKLTVSVAGDGISGGNGTALSVDHDGQGLQITGGQLALELDGTTLSKTASGLKVSSITNGEVSATAAIAISKLESIGEAKIIVGAVSTGIPTAVTLSGDVTIDGAGGTTIGSLVVTDGMLAGSITDGKLLTITSANKVSGSAVQLKTSAGLKNDSGLAVEPADLAGNGLEDNGSDKFQIKLDATSGPSGLLLSSNGLKVTGGNVEAMVAGESFSADVTMFVRLAISGETAGRVYKADNYAPVANPEEFYVIGVVKPASAITAGDTVEVRLLGEHTLDTAEVQNASDIGKPVFLSGTGGFTVVAPTTTDYAVVRVGILKTTTKVQVTGCQVMGIN